MAEWIKMTLGRDVELGSGDIGLKRGTVPLLFGPCLLWPNGWMDQSGQTAGWIKVPLSMEVDLGPGHYVLDGEPAPPKGAQQPPPPFWPRSIVATVAHLSYC